MPIGERSKFSCLKIDDDTSSSDEGAVNGTKMMKTTPSQTRNHGNQKKPAARSGSGGGIIVHPVPQKRKNKGKKAKKVPVIEEDGFIMQDEGDYLEKKYREDVQQAIENSRQVASTASMDVVQEIASHDARAKSQVEQEARSTKDPVEVLISEIDSKAAVLFTKNDGPQKEKEQCLVGLYRSKLVETVRKMMLAEEMKLSAEAEVIKYKNRYRKLCELLKDAEINEKAHMAADLEKARTVEKELSSQIGELRGELMQARSRIRELEIKYKEMVSKHQH